MITEGETFQPAARATGDGCSRRPEWRTSAAPRADGEGPVRAMSDFGSIRGEQTAARPFLWRMGDSRRKGSLRRHVALGKEAGDRNIASGT